MGLKIFWNFFRDLIWDDKNLKSLVLYFRILYLLQLIKKRSIFVNIITINITWSLEIYLFPLRNTSEDHKDVQLMMKISLFSYSPGIRNNLNLRRQNLSQQVFPSVLDSISENKCFLNSNSRCSLSLCIRHIHYKCRDR